MPNINKEFWLGQVFTLIATVVGVYLAANSGFNKALEFESLQHQRSVYYLQTSLLAEMQNNTQNIRKWVKQYQKNPRSNTMDSTPNAYRLELYLWETVQEGDIVFEMPYEQLKSIAGFYRQAELLLADLTSGNPFTGPSAAKKLSLLVESVEKNTVPKLQKVIQSEKERLSSLGVIE